MPVIRDDQQGGLSHRGAAVAVKTPVRQNVRRQAFLQRRTKTFRQVEQAVNEGRMTSGQAHKQLQRQGFVPGGTAYKKPPGWMKPGLQTIADVTQIVHDVPQGVYQSGKALGEDVRDYGKPGKTPFAHTRALGGGIVQSVAQDFRHPLRHPGYTLSDLAIGAGGVAKLGRLGADVAREAPQAVAKIRSDPRYLSYPSRLPEGAKPLLPRGAPRPPLKSTLGRMGQAHLRAAKTIARVAVPYGKRPYTNAALVRLEASRERNYRTSRTRTRLAAGR